MVFREHDDDEDDDDDDNDDDDDDEEGQFVRFQFQFQVEVFPFLLLSFRRYFSQTLQFEASDESSKFLHFNCHFLSNEEEAF